jgi:hypothetical protein
MPKRRTTCGVCQRDVALTHGGRIHVHQGLDRQPCPGAGFMVGPREVPSVTCPTCKGVGVIRPGAVRC